MRFSLLWGKRTQNAFRVTTGVFLVAGLLLTLVGADLMVREITDVPEVFVGVDVGYGDEEDVYKTADKVLGYANLIVLGSLDVTMNTTKLTRVCDYLYQKGFYFIVYVGYAEVGHLPPRGPDEGFFTMATYRWGNKFLGVYLFDEAGGKQIDKDHQTVPEADSYTEAAQNYTISIECYLDYYKEYYSSPNLRLFTSDYALYWYDYLSGYDVVFGEFVGNQSRQLAVALCRGAAYPLNKDWGIIITWKYNHAPFLEEAEQLYDDMVLAYENQAKYIVVFNSPENNTHPTPYGTLTPEHFDALERFWNYIKTSPRNRDYMADVAYVLPSDYGYGFRGPDDKIWGLWEADALSPQIWNDATNLLAAHGGKLDIVYESRIDGEPLDLPYGKLVFWNGNIVEK